MNLRRELIGIGLSSILIITAGISNAQEKTPVKMTVQKSLTTQLVQTAIDQGFFEQEGIEPEPITVTNGPAAATALASGAVDIATSAPEVFLAMASKGQSVKIISGGGLQHAALAARPGLELPKDYPASVLALKGKKIGVTVLSSAVQGLAIAMLESVGLHSTDVQFVAMGQGAPQALVNGVVDAAMVTDTQIILSEQLGATTVVDLRDSEQCPRKLVDIHLCGTSWLGTWAMGPWIDKNPDLVGKIRRALAKADRYLKESNDSQQITDALSVYLPKDTNDETKKKFIEHYRNALKASFPKDDLKAWINLEVETGVIAKPLTVDAVYAEGTPTTDSDVKDLAK